MTAAYRRIPLSELEQLLAGSFDEIVDTRDEDNPHLKLTRNTVARVILDGRSSLENPKRFPSDLFLKALMYHCGIRSCAASVIMTYGLRNMHRPLVEYYGHIFTSGSAHKLRQQLTKTNTRIDS